MTDKLPSYFEKYLNDKFEETNKKIEELAKVKDDIKFIQKQILCLVIAVVVLYILHVDQFGPTFLNSLKSLVGL